MGAKSGLHKEMNARYLEEAVEGQVRSVGTVRKVRAEGGGWMRWDTGPFRAHREGIGVWIRRREEGRVRTSEEGGLLLETGRMGWAWEGWAETTWHGVLAGTGVARKRRVKRTGRDGGGEGGQAVPTGDPRERGGAERVEGGGGEAEGGEEGVTVDAEAIEGANRMCAAAMAARAGKGAPGEVHGEVWRREREREGHGGGWATRSEARGCPVCCTAEAGWGWRAAAGPATRAMAEDRGGEAGCYPAGRAETRARLGEGWQQGQEAWRWEEPS